MPRWACAKERDPADKNATLVSTMNKPRERIVGLMARRNSVNGVWSATPEGQLGPNQGRAGVSPDYVQRLREISRVRRAAQRTGATSAVLYCRPACLCIRRGTLAATHGTPPAAPGPP